MTVPHGIDRSGAAGGTGAQGMVGSLNDLADPGADRIVFWDDSVGDLAWLSLDTGLGTSNDVLAITSAARTPLALATTDSPQFEAINLGHASDTTLTRVSAGVIAVEGVTLGGSFAAGTRMLFQQTTAPTGWTKEVSATYNDAALRFQTGTVTTGGSSGFIATMNAAGTTAGFTLTTAEIPSHTHTVPSSAAGGTTGSPAASLADTPLTSGATGGGGSHAHTLSSFNLKFADCIIATKD